MNDTKPIDGAVWALVGAASTDSERHEQLTEIRVSGGVAEATDGRLHAKADLDNPDPEADMRIRAADLGEAKRIARTKKTISTRPDGAVVARLPNGGMVEFPPPCETPWPDTSDLVPSASDLDVARTVTLSPKVLRTLCRLADDSKASGVKLSIPREKYRLIAFALVSGVREVNGVAMPMREE